MQRGWQWRLCRTTGGSGFFVNGTRSKAVIVQGNAETLTMGAFSGGVFGSMLEKTAKKEDEKNKLTASSRQLVRVINKSTRKMLLPGLAKLREKTGHSASSAKAMPRIVNHNVPGEFGGYAQFTLDVNDSFGSFIGSVTYNNYATQEQTVNGTANIHGTLDANRMEVIRLTLSFKSLNLSSNGFSASLIGTLSWGYNLSDSIETLSINMILLDRGSAQTYWFKNYEQITTYGANSLIQTVSGRYYDHVHGYVDFTTDTPLVARYGNSWPTAGTLRFTGQNDSSARLAFQTRNLLIEADTDGNGSIDYQFERQTNSQTDYNSQPTANAGSDRSAIQGATVTLDGTASVDLDGDGMEEIVGAAAWYKITIFDADRKTPSWEIKTSLDIGSLLVTDTNGDGVPEILYGDSQWGSIHAVDARSHTEKWTIRNPEHGVSGIALGDVDRDGKMEILWGAGGSSTGADHLYIADQATGTIKWQNMHIDGPLSAVDLGDVDNDGEDEIVMVSFESDSGYAEGVVHIFNARTRALKYQAKLGITDWMGVRSVKIGDVDGDGRNEYIVTTGNIYDGVIRVYDGVTHSLKRQSAGYNGNYFSALAIGDLNGDGKMEIVAGQGREHTGASGIYLIVLDGATLLEKWRSTDLGSSWSSVYDIKLADLNKDGNQEIIVSTYGNRLIIYDGVTHDQKLLLDHPARALAVADIDDDGTLEILAGRNDGKIDVFNGMNFSLKKTVSTYGTTLVDALCLADLDGGAAEWLVTSNGVLTVLDGIGQGLKWRSKNLSGKLGLFNHLIAKDTDGNGRKEVFVGSDVALYQFE